MARNLIVALIFCAAIVIQFSASYASPYPVLDYASTGEDYAVSDCGSASVDISTGQLTWSRGFLSFNSSTTYNIEFGLNHVSDTTGNPALGAAPWRHTYDIRINYIADPASLSLTTALGTVVPFVWDAQASLWRSTASYGLFLTCAVGSNPLDFTLSDKYGNTILFDDLGRPITITDRFNRAITLAYYTQGAASGLLYTVTDMWSRSIELIYDNTPLLTDLIDNTAPNSPSWLQFGYNNGDLQTITVGYSSGNDFAVWTFAYAAGYMDSFDDPDGVTTSFVWNANYLIVATDENANTIYVVYNPLVTTVTDRRGTCFDFYYSPSTPACVTQVYYPAPHPNWGAAANEYYSWNGDRLLTSHTTKGGTTYSYSYDTRGNRLSVSSILNYAKSWSYDATTNLLLTETDALSNVTTYEYDGSDRLYRIIYADDDPQNPTHPVVYAYDANSLISSVTDPEGNVVYYTYDSYGNTATETKSPDNGTTNYVTTYDRDAWGALNWVSTPNNNKTYYTRDGRRYTTQVSRDYDGATTSDTVYTHTDAGRVLTITDPLSNTTTNIYGSDGRRTGVSHADNAQERWSYDANGNTLTYTDGVTYAYNIANATSLYTKQYEYDAWDRRTKTYELAFDLIGNYTYVNDECRYDADSNTTHSYDNRGNLTTYSYDGLGRLLSETDPYNNSDLRVYDANGNLTAYTDKRNYTTTYTYDEMNRRVTEVAPLPAPDNTTTWTYDFNGNTKTVTDRLGAITRYFYDGMNRLVRTRNAYNRLVEEIGYDGEGNRLTVTDAWTNTVVYSYTRQGQVSTITKPDNGVFTYEYDLAGNVTRTVDEEGADTRFEHDVRNRVWRTTYAYGMPYEYQHVVAYDENGRTVSFTDGEGCVSETTYDPRGLVATTDYYKPDPNAIHSMTTKRYDAQGNLIYSTDPLNNTTSFDYDMMNRNWQVVKPSGATFTKSYDPNGNVSTETDGENNTTAYTYNSKGWCTQTTDAAANNFDKTYDAMGRVATETVSPDGGQTLYTTSYTRDALGNPTAITDPLNNTHLNFYDTAGRLDYYIDRNGNTVGFTYNNMNKASQISHPAPLNSNSASSTTINYTLRGDMLNYSSPEVNKEFVYDALRRKTLEGQYMPSWPTVPPGGMLYAEFGYDKKNRMTYTRDFSGMETVTVYDDVNQTKTVTDVTNNQTTNIGYDPAGNMTTKTSPNGLTDNYTYDNDNRLSYQEIRDSNNTLMGSKLYGYNNNHQIDWDEATGWFGAFYTDYNYNTRNMISDETRTGTNAYSKTYAYNGMRCRTVKVDNGITTAYTYNGLGRITTEVTGSTTWTYTYDNNGNLIQRTDGTNTETYQYSWMNNMVHYTDTNGDKDVYYGYDINGAKIVKAWEEEEEERMSSPNKSLLNAAFIPKIVTPITPPTASKILRTLTPGAYPYNTCADLNGEKFYYHKVHMSNVRNMRCDIFDTSSWDNDSSWIWEQAFINDPDSPISLMEFEETTYRKPNVGQYNICVDAHGSNILQLNSNQTPILKAEYSALGELTAAVTGNPDFSYNGPSVSTKDYGDLPLNCYYSGCSIFDAFDTTRVNGGSANSRCFPSYSTPGPGGGVPPLPKPWESLLLLQYAFLRHEITIECVFKIDAWVYISDSTNEFDETNYTQISGKNHYYFSVLTGWSGDGWGLQAEECFKLIEKSYNKHKHDTFRLLKQKIASVNIFNNIRILAKWINNNDPDSADKLHAIKLIANCSASIVKDVYHAFSETPFYYDTYIANDSEYKLYEFVPRLGQIETSEYLHNSYFGTNRGFSEPANIPDNEMPRDNGGKLLV